MGKRRSRRRLIRTADGNDLPFLRPTVAVAMSIGLLPERKRVFSLRVCSNQPLSIVTVVPVASGISRRRLVLLGFALLFIAQADLNPATTCFVLAARMSERWIAWVKYRRDRLFLQRIAWTIILKRARVTHWPVADKAMRKAFDRWRYLMGLSAVILVVGLACRLVNPVAFDNQPALRFLGHFVKTLGNFLELLGRIARESRVGVALKPCQTLHVICVGGLLVQRRGPARQDSRGI